MAVSAKELLMNIFFYFTEMDIQSQKNVYRYSQIIIILLSVIGFVIGFLKESFQIAVICNLIGTGLSIILFVPAWPIWKKKSLKFLPSQKTKKKTD